jgi:hypothetical protein
MAGAIRDSEGKLRGVVQLANKKGMITEKTVKEFGALIPALGEIVRNADDLRTFENVCTALQA